MPAATTPTAATPEKEDNLWIGLKHYIMHERQLKKQELEAEVEEERLRKEREARERQDVMTLGETREQIQILDTKLQELKNKKQELFLKLKIVLNQDEIRKKHQQQMETIETLKAVVQSGHPPQPGTHAQLFMPPRTLHQQALIPKMQQAGPPVGVQGGQVKRPRSPSPTAPQQGYYKTNSNQSYSHPIKIEEGRRTGDVMGRAVLWNKPTQQYTNAPGTLFFPTNQNPSETRNQSIIYPNYTANLSIPQQNLRQGYHVEMGQPGQGQIKGEMTVKPIASAQSQQQQQQQRNHQSQVTLEKIPERGQAQGPTYHHDERKDIRAPPPGIVYTTQPMRPGQMPMPYQQQQPKPHYSRHRY
ncbi:adenylate cyclase, terminal-differentiation specific [Lutzomyia longipalpis]|uniref:adenylate cyclase, terminal-differentiation specific n=1 Tax=Lutzomyia longipalpis TaxID=7200 RepID=UPI0024835232|nr:adenylate cyclase, terminal-differentiation specific [Lutzomyia longipalpis]